jgi:proteasome lid subunit RPN8/RPN11
MNIVNEKVCEEIEQHANENRDEECCGYVVLSNDVLQTVKGRNIAENRKEHFVIDPYSYLKAFCTGKIVASYHSQKPLEFSEKDVVNSEGHKLPMILFSLDTNKINIYNPIGNYNKYVGKPYKLGSSDCFSIIRNYYKNELNIDIKDYPRDVNWVSKPGNDYERYYQDEGFFQVEDLAKNDIILLKFPQFDHCSHAVIYMGNDIILHHLIGQYSSLCFYNESYKKMARYKLRHALFKRTD